MSGNVNNYNKFLSLREKYPTIIYEKYDIEENNENILITYYFNIPSLVEFRPTLTISKKNITNHNINIKYRDYLIFHIGLIELISYFKCTCSPNVIVSAGYINEEQIKWFKKLFYYGLGEFLYVNGITIDIDELLNITCTKDYERLPIIDYKGIGNLIPIGGGKDSIVSLELLKSEYENNTCFIINPKEVTLKCAYIAGYKDQDIFTVQRKIDSNLIDLNKQGFLNGHTPFSSLAAFISYLCAYLSNKKYIVLSNEASANEATVVGTKINHQYSKTYEFENDFNEYTKKYFNIDIKYFSLLRPLSEFQIGLLFSNYEKYHTTFKSCNVGSKKEKWQWCCNCPKCLFVYIILSPFLYKDKLINIFGEDLFANEELLETFIELLGYSKTKPFECVGTYSEVRYATSLVIDKLKDEKLPFLLKFYKDNYKLELEHKFENEYNNVNNLNEHFTEILKKELDKYV